MTTNAGIWRVVLDDNTAREVEVNDRGEMTRLRYAVVYRADGGVSRAPGETPRRTLANLADMLGWDVVEIVAPGEMTAAERLAVVTAERDDARLMSQCNRDNWRLAGEQRDALVRAVTEYHCEVDSIAAMPDAQEAAAALAAYCSAPTALDAALAVARGER